MGKRLPILVLFALLAAVPPLQARPAHKKALADFLGAFLPHHLNDCRTCHVPEQPGEKHAEGEKPHNPFGARLYAVRRELRDADKDSTIPARIQAIAAEDSDGDGSANFIELLAGRNPGEAADKPTADELVKTKRLTAAFDARKPYDWQPFKPVVRPPLPAVKNADWVQNPIDAFIAAEHELYGLKPRPRAPADVLLRRVYLDLIGVPPSPKELQALLADPSDAAYRKLVDNLLASPKYGERWARHWMDVWRYVDGGTSGLQDGWVGAGNMWRWRDWIIDSLNNDKGYDRMVQEMLAGDELADDPQILAATAFLARNNNRSRDNWLHDTVNHTSRAFLGVMMECARCHDHKYDAILHVEYYQMRAIFEPHNVRNDPGPEPTNSQKKDKATLTRVVDSGAGAKTYLYIRGIEQNPDKSKALEPGVPSFLGTEGFQVVPVAFTTAAGKKIGSTGRRLALARWLTRRDNPLTARVAANHIWLRHFGKAIVATTFNFGADGQPPTNPALLDWLAAELMEPSQGDGSAWSMKHLHRLIVTSNAYRMSSTPEADNLAFDPENQFLWRMPLRRMEAEVVRDSLLAVAGTLDSAMHGPELDPKKGLEIPRRSIYFRYSDSEFLRFLEAFDPPAVEDCYRRAESIIPQQALTLLNSDVALSQARVLARKLADNTDDSKFVREAFRHVLARACTAEEEKACVDFLSQQVKFYDANKARIRGTTQGADIRHGAAEPKLRAQENLVHLLFNHHDFVTIR